ncbi:MAG: hypothetical protein ACRDNT_04415 [Streptosporangiaceae bacterium]
MRPPDPFAPPPPGGGPASPAQVVAALARALARQGITGVYTAAAEKLAVISVSSGLTAWTNGRILWCTWQGQRRTWAAADMETAAAQLAALARPAAGS